MIVMLNEAEEKALKTMSETLEISPMAVLRQGLRCYQLIVVGTHELREINPTPKAPPDTDWHKLVDEAGQTVFTIRGLAQVPDTSEKTGEKDGE